MVCLSRHAALVDHRERRVEVDEHELGLVAFGNGG